jgi:hypothetical protein
MSGPALSRRFAAPLTRGAASFASGGFPGSVKSKPPVRLRLTPPLSGGRQGVAPLTRGEANEVSGGFLHQ